MGKGLSSLNLYEGETLAVIKEKKRYIWTGRSGGMDP